MKLISGGKTLPDGRSATIAARQGFYVYVQMKNEPVVESVIRDDGLRYKVKPSGTQFPTTGRLSTGTMSCFKCGTHRPLGELEYKPVIGMKRRVCKGGCRKTA